jgi:hypothetical protein
MRERPVVDVDAVVVGSVVQTAHEMAFAIMRDQGDILVSTTRLAPRTDEGGAWIP